MENYNNPEETAKNILFSKYNEWKYEQEVRIVQENEWYHLETPIKKIIVGCRIENSVFDVFKIICKKRNIDLRIIGIGDDGLDEDFVDLNNV
jgi:hypothetical protein